MPSNIEKMLSWGAEYLWASFLDSTYGVAVGSGPALAEGDHSPAARMLGVQGVNFSYPEPEDVPIPGDLGVMASRLFPAKDLIKADITVAVADLAFIAVAQGTKNRTIGAWTLGVIGPRKPIFRNVALLLSSPAEAVTDGADSGLSMYHNILVHKAQLAYVGGAAPQNRDALNSRFKMSTKFSKSMAWGDPFTVEDDGVLELVAMEFGSTNPCYMEHFHGDNIVDTFTLAQLPAGDMDSDTTHCYRFDTADSSVTKLTSADVTVDPDTGDVAYDDPPEDTHYDTFVLEFIPNS